MTGHDQLESSAPSPRSWEILLTPKRIRTSSTTAPVQHWNPFDSDYSRISLSAPFRRLQDKAQVFPFDDNDFVRTRLTHSIEVSGIARSMGVLLENFLIEKKKELPIEKRGHIPSILSVAGLIHDIGNPPFGHFGEKSIQDFFLDTDNNKLLDGLNQLETNDLKNFEGNAQGLRLLLRLGLAKDPGSYNLTFPTLASIIKYPYDSISGNKRDWERKICGLGVSYKKFGYFQTEKDHFEKINTALKLNSKRHPLCFILEAADDICYSASDIEDGVKKKTITIDFLITQAREKKDSRCKGMLKILSEMQKQSSKTRLDDQIIAQQCRIYAQQHMIRDAIDAFQKNYSAIMCGSFDQDLIDSSKSKEIRHFFKTISKANFEDKTVVKREIVGNKVIKFLAKEFVYAAVSKGAHGNATHGKLYGLIPALFKKAKQETEYSNEHYLDILMAIDFICSMTDSYALSLYNELRGSGR